MPDANTDSELLLQTGHSNAVTGVVFVNKNVLASTGLDTTVRLWDLRSGKEMRRMGGEHDYGVHAFFSFGPRANITLALSPDGRTLASVGSQSITLRAVDDEDQLLSLKDHQGPNRALAFDHSGETLLSLAGTTLHFWDLRGFLSRVSDLEEPYQFRAELFVEQIIEDSTPGPLRLQASDVVLSVNGRTHFGSPREVIDFMRRQHPLRLEVRRGDQTFTIETSGLRFEFRPYPIAPPCLRQIELKYDSPLDIDCATFSPVGDLLAIGKDRAIDIHDTKTGKVLRTLEGHEQQVECLAFSTDGTLLASGSKDHTARITEVTSGTTLPLVQQHAETISALTFSPDAGSLVSAGGDQVIKLLNLKTGYSSQILAGLDSVATSLIFRQDGKILAAGSSDGTVALWSTDANAELRTLSGKSGDIVCLAVGGKDEILAVASAQQTIKIFDLGRAGACKVLGGYTNQVSCLSFSDDGNYLAGGSWDTTVKVWGVPAWAHVRAGEVAKLTTRIRRRVSNFVRARLGMTRIPGDEKEFEELRQIEHGEPVTSVAFAGNLLAVGTGDSAKIMTIWHLATGRRLLQLEPRGDDPQVSIAGSLNFLPLAYTAQTGSLAAGQHYNKIDLYNLWSRTSQVYEAVPGVGQITANMAGYDMAQSVALSADGKLLAGGWGKIKIWDTQTGEELHTLEGNLGRVQSLAFSPDGELLASGGREGLIHLWEVQSGEHVRTLSGHKEWVRSLVFVRDGKMLVSSDFRGRILFWNIEDGTDLASLVTFGERDYAIITPDNYYLASKQAVLGVAFRVGDSVFPFEQFDLKFNRPDIVLARLGYASGELLDAYYRLYQKRLAHMGLNEEMLGDDFHLPEVSIYDDDLNLSTVEKVVRLRVKATDSKFPLERLNVYVNDVPVYGSGGMDLKNEAKMQVEREMSLELSDGRNKIQISALNERGAESLKETIEVVYNGPRTAVDLYLIAIGVSDYPEPHRKLKYAAKDGADIAAYFAGEGGYFREVKILTLLDADATQANILRAGSFFKETKVDDHAVVFIAGHGVLDDALDYYFAPVDMDFSCPSAKGVSYNMIEGLLDGIRARKKLLLMDTCHSGEVDKDDVPKTRMAPHVRIAGGRGTLISNEKKLGLRNSYALLREIFAELRRGSGAVVIASAGGFELAWEFKKLRNGIFTHAVLEGLRDKKARQNNNGVICVSELRDYVAKRVQELTRGDQNPTARRENLEFNFRVN